MSPWATAGINAADESTLALIRDVMPILRSAARIGFVGFQRSVHVGADAGLARRARAREPARPPGGLAVLAAPGRAAVPEALRLGVLARIACHCGRILWHRAGNR